MRPLVRLSRVASATVGHTDSLALSAHLALGDYPTAEFHAHRCLAGLRPHMRRSQAITMTRLAHAQLAQDDLETATATAM